ncbi:MAG: Autotransporter-associated beta strand repeat protein, partial [Akkermansiaceae bacterium]|nr:Autotransporter-associated beta strand repeat protein [Akkermansiaceae bacterium]
IASTGPAVEQGGSVISHGGPSLRAASGAAVFARRKDYAQLGLDYFPQFSTDLQTWTNSVATPAVIAADADVEILSVPLPAAAPGQSRFFRILVTQP